MLLIKQDPYIDLIIMVWKVPVPTVPTYLPVPGPDTGTVGTGTGICMFGKS